MSTSVYHGSNVIFVGVFYIKPCYHRRRPVLEDQTPGTHLPAVAGGFWCGWIHLRAADPRLHDTEQSTVNLLELVIQFSLLNSNADSRDKICYIEFIKTAEPEQYNAFEIRARGYKKGKLEVSKGILHVWRFEPWTSQA